jgi:penicillin G amidase
VLRIGVRELLVLLVTLALIAALAWTGGRWYLARSAADYDGTRTMAGLAHPVDVTFDARGIPQIWAQTYADLYFALGWVHASERLFQMELVRRMSAGRLAEVFGEAGFRSDVRQRRIGFERIGASAAAALNGTALAHFDAAFSSGLALCRNVAAGASLQTDAASDALISSPCNLSPRPSWAPAVTVSGRTPAAGRGR